MTRDDTSALHCTQHNITFALYYNNCTDNTSHYTTLQYSTLHYTAPVNRRDYTALHSAARIICTTENSLIICCKSTVSMVFPQANKEDETIIIPAVYQCTCQYKSYFTATLYAYKGLLILFGLFLAWETRNVTIPALNDSKYIGMCVYNVVILSIIGAIVSIALENTMQQETPYAITSLCLLTCTTVTVLLVFVPKVWPRKGLLLN